MADTSPITEAAEAVGAAETIRISDSLVALLRQLLLKIVIAYNATYYDEDSTIPILVRDTLISDIIFSKGDIDVSGPHDSEAVCSNNHRLTDGEWEDKPWCCSVPPEDIQGLLKSLQEAVRGQGEILGRVMFDTSDNGLSWRMVIFKDDDDWEGTTYELGSIGAEGLYFHTCKKFV